MNKGNVFNLIVHPLPLEVLVNKLKNREPFSIQRFGDGEALVILNAQGANCDGSQYGLPNLRKALAQTLTAPLPYYHCIAPKITTRKNGLKEWMYGWIERYAPTIEWYDSEAILNASVAGELKPFTDALRKHKLMLVGPAHLRKVPLPIDVFVEVPPVNAWLQYDKILAEIKRNAYQTDTIMFCAGFVSKIAIYDLFPALGQTHFLADIGSTFDYAVGVMSRSYSRRLKPEEVERLKIANFGK